MGLCGRRRVGGRPRLGGLAARGRVGAVGWGVGCVIAALTLVAAFVSLTLARPAERTSRPHPGDMSAMPSYVQRVQPALVGLHVRAAENRPSSARLGAGTTDPAWEERYNAHVPLLDAAIKRFTELTPVQTDKKTADMTDQANQALIAMETRAFELIHQGNAREARSVLFSDEYARQKKLYGQGMAEYTAKADAHIAARIANDAFSWLDAPVRRIAATDTFVAYAPELEDVILPQVDSIRNAMEELVTF